MLNPSVVNANGNTVSWTIKICNTHQVTNTNVVAALVIPPGLSVDLGHSYTSDGSSLTETAWSIGDLPANTCRTAIVGLTVDNILQGPYVVSAIVTGDLAESNLTNNVLQETITTQCPCFLDTFLVTWIIDDLEGPTGTFTLPAAFANIPNDKIHAWVDGVKIYFEPPDENALQWTKVLGSTTFTTSESIQATSILEVWGWKC